MGSSFKSELLEVTLAFLNDSSFLRAKRKCLLPEGRIGVDKGTRFGVGCIVRLYLSYGTE